MLGAERGATPLMLLDDVMSELDAEPPRAARRRARLAAGRASSPRPTLGHVPGASSPVVTRIAITPGNVLQEAAAA